MKWIRLTSGKGQGIYIDADRLVYISAPFTASKFDESRQILIANDVSAYILNSPDNYKALKGAKIDVGGPEEWGQPRGRTTGKTAAAPRLVKRNGTPAKLEPGSKEFTRIVLDLHEGLQKIGIAYTGEAMGTLIRDAVLANPGVTVETVAELLRKQKAARS